jgi:hypothetical protein
MLDENIPTTEKYPPHDLKKWLTEEDFKKKRPKMEKRKERDERLYPESEPDIRGSPTTVPRWKGLAIHYALSATPIYPSTILWECKETEDQRTNMDWT